MKPFLTNLFLLTSGVQEIDFLSSSTCPLDTLGVSCQRVIIKGVFVVIFILFFQFKDINSFKSTQVRLSMNVYMRF